MQIWVDADACPKVIKEILYRAAERTRVPVILVANKLGDITGIALAVGSTQTIGTTENRNGAVTMSATKNASFAGTVTAVAFADYGDPTSPYGTTLSPITLTPTPATPPSTESRSASAKNCAATF